MSRIDETLPPPAGHWPEPWSPADGSRRGWSAEHTIAAGFAVVVVCLAVLAIVAVDLLGAARAFIGAESVWSKAQKTAVRHLATYSRSGDEADWARFHGAVAVPLAYRVAREALDRPEPDISRATRGLLDGGSDAYDVPCMIRLYRWGRGLERFEAIAAQWRAGDVRIAELLATADVLRAEVRGPFRADAAYALAQRVRALDEELTPIETRFSARLAESARAFEQSVLLVLAGAGALLACSGSAAAAFVVRRRRGFERQLAESAERHRRAVHGSGDALWHWDLGSGEIDFSRRLEALLGYQPGSVGRSLEAVERALIHADDLPPVRAAVERHLREGKPFDVELRLRAADGGHRWFRLRAQGERLPGAAPRLAGSATDVTEPRLAREERDLAAAALREAHADLERRVAERTHELAEAVERLQRLDRAKSDFLAQMSHELRTPLNAILGFSELLLAGLSGPLNDGQRRQLGYVEGAGRHLLALIDDLLDMAAVEAGRLEYRREDVDLRELVDAVHDQLRPVLTRKALDWRCSAGPGAHRVFGDRRRCLQILLNLGANAAKFTDEGGVTVELGGDASSVHVSVSDTGIGITPEQVSRLFRPFVQLDSGSARAHEGSGLGLFLSLKFAQAMGGTIDVESAPGCGSRFTLRLPRGTVGAGEAGR